MNNGLISSLRLGSFIVMFLYLITVGVLLTVWLLLRKRRGSTVLYLTALSIGIAILMIVETPLVDESAGALSIVLGYCLLIVSGVCVFNGIMRKDPTYFVEAIIWLFLTPAFSFIYQVQGYVYLASLIWLFLRLLLHVYMAAKHIREDESRFLIKNALDQLHDGVLFGNRYRQTIYMSPSLAKELTSLGIELSLAPDRIVASLKEKATHELSPNVFVIQDEDAYYQFSITYDGRFVSEISMTNVTEEENNFRALNQIIDQNEAAIESLRKSILSADTQTRIEEYARIKAAVHDAFAQKLSILHRYLENPATTSYLSIKEMLASSRATISSSMKDEAPISLEFLTQTYGLIGLQIVLQGKLPSEENKKQVFLQILKECCTNAVKHGDAKQVLVNIQKKEGHYTMSVTNNGKSSSIIHEGNGLRSIRFRLAQIDGEAEIHTEPYYTLIVKA